jgi:hypothetical protein
MKRVVLPLLLLVSCSDDETPATTPPPSAVDGGATEDAASVPDGNTGEVTPPRRVFVTKALRTGANGGPAGADEVCAQEAKIAMLTGTFVAWLSTPTSKAIDKLRTDAAFITTDGQILWNKRADIEAGIGPKVPITADSRGMPVTGFTQVWTGADGSGQPTVENCNGWTSNAAGLTGGAGVFGGTGKEWTQAAAPSHLRDCGQSAPLLCFEK